MPNKLLRILFFPFKCHVVPQEETQTESTQQNLTTCIAPVNITSGNSLLVWAVKAESLLHIQKQLHERDIYSIYRTPCIKQFKAHKLSTQKRNFKELLTTAKQNQDYFRVYCIPSRMGIVPKTNPNKEILINESLNQFKEEDLLDLTWFFSQDSRSIIKTESTQARISICSSAENYKQLIAILASLMHPDHELNKIIAQAKILGPGIINSSKETAILYLNHEELNEESFRKLQQILKPLDDSNSKGIPFGMHPLTYCAGYGEQSFEDRSKGNSFGSSRSEIIYSAIENRLKKPGISLAETLPEECSKKGLDPLHPAFCSGNYSKFHIEYI